MDRDHHHYHHVDDDDGGGVGGGVDDDGVGLDFHGKASARVGVVRKWIVVAVTAVAIMLFTIRNANRIDFCPPLILRNKGGNDNSSSSSNNNKQHNVDNDRNGISHGDNNSTIHKSPTRGGRPLLERISGPVRRRQQQQQANEEEGEASSSSWGCQNLPDDLRYVLEPHCRIHPDLPLSDMLPDLDFFRRIVHAFVGEEEEGQQHGKHTQPQPRPQYAIVAGRGTTGTRTIFNWVSKMNPDTGAIHYTDSHCSTEYLRQCYKTHLRKGVDRIRNALTHIRGKAHDGIQVQTHQYDKLIQALLAYVEKPLYQCTKYNDNNETVQEQDRLQQHKKQRQQPCHDRLVVLMDSPFVLVFTELYMALGPTTRVILSRRDSVEWSDSRSQHHSNSTTGFICQGAPWYKLLDPFSYTQCAAAAKQLLLPLQQQQQQQQSLTNNTDKSSINGVDNNVNDHGPMFAVDFDEADKDTLLQSYEQYNMYVHSLVPANYLLDLNLFTSSVLDAAAAAGGDDDNNSSSSSSSSNGLEQQTHRDKWNQLNKQLVQEFLSDI